MHVHVLIYTNADLHVNVCGSSHCCGCVVDGNVAMEALWVLFDYSGVTAS